MMLSQFLPINSKQDVLFHCMAYDYSCADWDGLCDHLKDVPWEDIFKLSASTVNFVRGFRLEFMYISLIKSIRSNLTHLHGFQQLELLPQLIETFFFCLYQHNKSESKVKFKQASNCCRRFLEAAKLTYATKTKEFITSQRLGSWDFWRMANSVSTKVNLLYLLYSTDWRCCLLHLTKQNCLLKTLLRTLILMTLVSLYLFSLLELI